MTITLDEANAYMAERTGSYGFRSVRYREAVDQMTNDLKDSDTVYDIGAGWTEFDYCLRTYGKFRGRYIPVDAGIDGTDLEQWIPKNHAKYAVALELLEHLDSPLRLIAKLQLNADNVIVSVPNPRTVDVLGIDRTHVTIVTRELLEACGFEVTERTFYGGVFSNGEPDSLFGVWRK